MSFSVTLLGQSKWLVLVEAVILAGLIGWIDEVTGWEWSLFIFYALPIVLVVARTDRRYGIFFALLCAVIWSAANIESNPYQTRLGFALAAATRLFYFVVLVVATAASKAQRELDRARIEKLEHAQELEREILRTSEREQQRIGRDLHDSLGPHLAAIGYAASFLANELRGRDLAEAASAQKIGELVAEAVSLTRDLARGLFPVQMGGAGLCMALEDLANTTSRRRGIAVSFCESGDPRIEDPREAMHLYRIAQEAVHNAAKHGGATSVTIVLGKSEGCLRLIIADDGKGLPQSQNITRGVGLHSMRSRALALKGIIEITSNPGEGTIVSCEIPLGSIELAAVVP